MVALGLLALAGLLAPAASHLVGERHTAFRRAPAGPPNFSYQGETGPLGWEAIDPAKYGTCAHGKEQSPINFHAGYQKNVLNNGSNRPKLNYPSISSAEIVNLGNTIETEAAGGELTLPSDGSVWKVVQFHFHTPSEHRLSDEWFPLEIHFVHKKKGMFFSASSLPDGPNS
jgi:carbonic anhydrase